MTPPLTMPAEPGSDQTSWLPLLGVQRRSHSRVYAMQANEYATGEEALAASRAASDRLRGAAVKRIAGPRAQPAPEPEPEIGPTPEPAFIVTYVEPPPLVMLGPCSWRFLVAYTALRHGLQPEQIISPSRARPVALARHEAIYLIAKHTPLSLLRISRLLRRNHTTILSSLKKFPKLDRRHLGYGGGIVRYSSSKPMVSPVVHTVHS